MSLNISRLDLPVTEDFKSIILNNTPLIDVRAPVEYLRGSFPCSTNLALMLDEEYQEVGLCYKQNGQESAIKLGYELVTPKIQDLRVNTWIEFIKNNPKTVLYCFRGGMRSKISQDWIWQKSNIKVVRLQGGYKKFRNYLLQHIEHIPDMFKDKVSSIVLSGHTGSGKTKVLHNIEHKIDLEGLANHRGSAFGKHISSQPSQIDFENSLVYKLIQGLSKDTVSAMVFEDEGTNIGAVHLPKELFQIIQSSDKVILESSLDDRVVNTLQEYVVLGQEEYIHKYSELKGINLWQEMMLQNFSRIKKRMGGELYNRINNFFSQAMAKQLLSQDLLYHRRWIKALLTEYYDPMYEYQLKQNKSPIIFRGSFDEIVEFLNDRVSIK